MQNLKCSQKNSLIAQDLRNDFYELLIRNNKILTKKLQLEAHYPDQVNGVHEQFFFNRGELVTHYSNLGEAQNQIF